MRVVESMCLAAEKTAGCECGSAEIEGLRAKTDRQLIRIVESDLDLGLRAARQALNSADTWTVCAEQLYSRAKLAHDEVACLLPFIREIAGDQIERWEARLGHLR